MDKAFVAKMKESLQNHKEELIKSLIAESSDFKQMVEDMNPKDLCDIAADDVDRKTIAAIGEQEMRRLRLIDSALSRIENGRYGLCIKCDKKIPKERLEAIPYALMCISCQTSEERKNR